MTQPIDPPLPPDEIDEVSDDDEWRDSIPPPDPLPGGKRAPLRIVKEVEKRPDIIINPDVHVTTERMADALKADPELYQRGGALAHVIRSDATHEGTVPGTPVTRPAPLSFLTDRVSRFARCVRKIRRKEGESWAHVAPPIASVRAVLERGSWPGIRELRSILEAPSLRPDGTVIQAPGYDAATGCLYEPNAKFRPVADKPTHSDCVLAYARLAEPFKDFPYVSEAHRDATIAAMLTLLGRPMVTGSVPCWLFDASAARSGKSLQVDVISLVASGRVASRTTYPETDEELEKVISSYALRGASVVNFDNVARKFGGAALDKVITAVDQVDMRVLGSSTISSFDWRAVVFASGNNVTCRGDMLARVLSPRLETPLDNPERRTDLTYPDLRAWVKSHRVDLVHAALTLLRGYVAAGSPDQGCPRWGGFESWSRLVPHALVWVGASDPMGARRGLEGDDDPERVYSAALVDGWARLCVAADAATKGVTVKAALAFAYPHRHGADPDGPPDGLDDLREAIEAVTDAKPGFPPSARRLGDAIRRLKARPIGGRRFDGVATHGGVTTWRVVKAS